MMSSKTGHFAMSHTISATGPLPAAFAFYVANFASYN
jgi:hypothetical protein